MGNLYVVLTRLWSPSQNRDILPGEVVEMEGEIVNILLKKGAIRPAISRIIEEKELENNGTNNQ